MISGWYTTVAPRDFTEKHNGYGCLNTTRIPVTAYTYEDQKGLLELVTREGGVESIRDKKLGLHLCLRSFASSTLDERGH